MTAYEMVDGEYYAQGSDEYYAAMQNTTKPVHVSFLVARELQKSDYARVPAIIIRATMKQEKSE